MADFKLKKRVDFTFALEGDEDTVYTIPSIKSLPFETVQAMSKMEKEEDLAVKFRMVRTILYDLVPALEDKGLSDIELSEIINAYDIHQGKAYTGE